MISFIFSFKLWLRKTIASIYLVLIAILSLLPSYDLPDIPMFEGEDKAIHVCMYFGLAILVCWSFDFSRKRMGPLYLMLAGVFFWGVLMEILQRTMHNGRNFDFRDMIANLVGALAGLMLYRYFDRLRSEQAERVFLQRKIGEID